MPKPRLLLPERCHWAAAASSSKHTARRHGRPLDQPSSTRQLLGMPERSHGRPLTVLACRMLSARCLCCAWPGVSGRTCAALSMSGNRREGRQTHDGFQSICEPNVDRSKACGGLEGHKLRSMRELQWINLKYWNMCQRGHASAAQVRLHGLNMTPSHSSWVLMCVAGIRSGAMRPFTDDTRLLGHLLTRPAVGRRDRPAGQPARCACHH